MITWFLEGDVGPLSCGRQLQICRLARCAVNGCQTHPVIVATFSGAFYYVDIPPEYQATFR